MATTTNYGWTTPDDTDLVKDGASAIRSLGSAIDTSLNTALGTKKAGLVLLNTTSFTAVASQSFNNVFNSTYDTYLINGIFATSTTIALRFRYRVAGSDNSTANSYVTSRFVNYTPAASGAESTTDSFALPFGDISSLGRFTMTVYDPFTAIQTYADSSMLRDNNTLMARSNISHNQATSYDGISFIASTGTITGSIKIYGYNK